MKPETRARRYAWQRLHGAAVRLAEWASNFSADDGSCPYCGGFEREEIIDGQRLRIEGGGRTGGAHSEDCPIRWYEDARAKVRAFDGPDAPRTET